MDNTLDFSINLNIEDILNSDIQTYIFKSLESYNIVSRVIFEIVKSKFIENFDGILDLKKGIDTNKDAQLLVSTIIDLLKSKYQNHSRVC
jgi:hypothetical protein